jgi:hypothetical protein
MTPELIAQVFALAAPLLHERYRRLFAAMLARSYGLGGISVVAKATRLARSTLERGVTELEGLDPVEGLGEQLRRPGGGQKPATVQDPELEAALQRLVDPVTRGDPESPLPWVSKSIRHLAAALTEQGHPVSAETVRRLLHRLDFSLQANRKTKEGRQHPDRNAQFEFIAQQTQRFLDEGQPVLSVDTKKKERVGEYANAGREWQPQRTPEPVNTHDFPDPQRGKGLPYGVYDQGADEGWESVGISADTAEFAVATIERWWREMGSQRYPEARHLMITADGGGSNSVRGRLWKTSLQGLADRLGLRLWVCHYPPGTSKWNKIEHRLFSRITQNWRGRPLISLEVIVNLIATARTANGTRVQAAVDPTVYEKGTKVTPEALAQVRLLLQEFHSEWNYVILPTADWPDWPPAEHEATI